MKQTLLNNTINNLWDFVVSTKIQEFDNLANYR